MLNLDTHILLYALTGDLTPRERSLLANETCRMTGRDRKRQRMVDLEIAVHHLRVGPAHAGRRDFQQDLIGCYFGNFDIFENKRLSVTMHSRCAHWHSSLANVSSLSTSQIFLKI